MDVQIQFAWRRRTEDGVSACGVVVVDRGTERVIHAAGHFLGALATDEAAALTAMLRSIETVTDLGPDAVDLRCADERLVQQVTTAAPIGDADAAERFEQALAALLRFDTWQLRLVGEPGDHHAADLAERALAEATGVRDVGFEEARERQHRDHTGVPQWVVELLESPGDRCPARCPAGKRFPFGPDTPAGFCIHAAIAVLTDGPLTWTDPDQRRMSTVCPHCDAPMRIERAGE